MARVTVEDCILRIPNRFELVMVAAQRARDITAGAPLTVQRDNDKNPVVALREVADGTVNLDLLRHELVHGLRRHVEAEETEESLATLAALREETHAPHIVQAEEAAEDAADEVGDEETEVEDIFVGVDFGQEDVQDEES
jgi:DNA-directed RNA polymerase subunit omega